MKPQKGIVFYSCLIVLFFCMTYPAIAAEEGTQPKAAVEENNTTATEDGAENRKNVFDLGEIEVISTQDSSGNPTAVRVESKALREFEADTVPDISKLVPGLSVERRGAKNETMLRIRGFDQKHVPIYVDGIPIYVPYDGYPDLGRFSTLDLSEIVISKGFTSVLYGPNTMGGAINMVSRRPVEKFEGGGGVRIDTNGFNTYLNVGSNQGAWYLQGSASLLDSDWYRLPSSFDETAEEDGGKRENSYKKDGKLNIKLGLTPDKTDEYSITYINQHGEKGTPPYTGSNPATKARYWRWPYWDKQSLYLNTKTAMGKKTTTM